METEIKLKVIFESITDKEPSTKLIANQLIEAITSGIVKMPKHKVGCEIVCKPNVPYKWHYIYYEVRNLLKVENVLQADVDYFELNDLQQ